MSESIDDIKSEYELALEKLQEKLESDDEDDKYAALYPDCIGKSRYDHISQLIIAAAGNVDELIETAKWFYEVHKRSSTKSYRNCVTKAVYTCETLEQVEHLCPMVKKGSEQYKEIIKKGVRCLSGDENKIDLFLGKYL